MNEGLDRLLDRIRQSPKDEVLLMVFVNLAAECEDGEKKCDLLLKAIQSVFFDQTTAALKIALEVFRYANEHAFKEVMIKSLKIMISCMKIEKRIGKAEILKQELEKLTSSGEFKHEDSASKIISIAEPEDQAPSSQEYTMFNRSEPSSLHSPSDVESQEIPQEHAQHEEPLLSPRETPPVLEIQRPLTEFTPEPRKLSGFEFEFDITPKPPPEAWPQEHQEFTLDDRLLKLQFPHFTQEQDEVSQKSMNTSPADLSYEMWRKLYNFLTSVDNWHMLSTAFIHSHGIESYLDGQIRRSEIQISQEIRINLLDLIESQNDYHSSDFRDDLLFILWQGFGAEGAIKILSKCALQDQIPYFFGEYIDQLIKRDRARRALHEIRTTITPNASLELAGAAYKRTKTIFDCLKLRCFNWNEQDGVAALITLLSKRTLPRLSGYWLTSSELR